MKPLQQAVSRVAARHIDAGKAEYWPEALERAKAKGLTPVEDDGTRATLYSFFDGVSALSRVAEEEPLFRKDGDIRRLAAEAERLSTKLHTLLSHKYLWD